MHGDMTSLVWKEYRQNRQIVWILMVFLCLPYLLGGGAFAWGLLFPDDFQPLGYFVWTASFFSLVLAQLAIAMIGGNLIAGERADRSAEFAAYLPIPKSQSLAAKLLLVAAMAAIIWLPNAPVHWCFLDEAELSINARASKVAELLLGVAVNGLLLFSVAWLCSSILSSPAISVVLALLAPVVIAGVISLTVRFGCDVPLRMHMAVVSFWYNAISVPVSLICFLIGTWLYMRRVEP
jgi:ABC-type transport system involved in multi-copper enzyme maturation permease subunit